MSRIEIMEYADECNRTGGFAAMPENTRRGRMKFLRQYENQNGLCALCGQWFAPAAMTRPHHTPRKIWRHGLGQHPTGLRALQRTQGRLAPASERAR